MLFVMDRDDKQYTRWLRDNPKGYVLNTRREPDPEYMVLHRASCYTINRTAINAAPGGFTERAYIKVCSDNIQDLQNWVKKHGRLNGSFSKECSRCNG